ncbi:MAG: hypothetical protein IJ566_03300 [Cardiobacteriaceae bacterium]|nr:hypothetical protein [Cardiobacteriaceae bacterium]
MLKKTLFALIFGLSFLSVWAKDMKIKITVNNQEFTATLQDNKATQELVQMLPLQLDMTELNGNEKYHQFKNKQFSTQSQNVKNIANGDLMLFGDNYLVIFYQDFKTNYSYTPLGKVDNPKNLPKALGRGNVRVKIEK